MRFTVRPVGSRPSSGRNAAYLITDNWDDWFQFSTMYRLVVFDAEGKQHDLGDVKIGQFGMAPGERRPALPGSFESLGEEFFSIGQDATYYEGVDRLGPELRDTILTSLRDAALDLDLFERAKSEPVTRTSLLRSVSSVTVRSQFHRLALGHSTLTEYDFRYTAPRAKSDDVPPLEFAFHVEPDSQPPSNIHVLIGRNGVGKTRVLRLMSRALVAKKQSLLTTGVFSSDRLKGEERLFANLVSVTFSAFDPFQPLPEQRDATLRVRYAYVGLQRPRTADNKPQSPKSPRVLMKEFVSGTSACRRAGKIDRWRRSLEALETDPLFKEAEVTRLSSQEVSKNWESEASGLFKKLSSGHKIVLLTITKLVEEVDERTLVLLDEPEAHLHPPLLSAFVRALSNLLVERNGVAIVATHSPVVLQEVPRTCVWKLRRTGEQAFAERPEVETFGENVGVLTREAFGLEVTESGFHQLLKHAVSTGDSYEEVVQRFDAQLGAEASAIARALVVTRDNVVE
jgi:hypothetical protein